MDANPGDSKPAKFLDRKKQFRLVTHCLYCGAELTGRSDQKFCTSGCKSAFHNERNSLEKAPARKYFKAFLRNDRILDQLNRIHGEDFFPVSVLPAMGFDGTIRGKKIKDDRTQMPGELFIRFSMHLSDNRKSIKILCHEV